MSDYLKSTNFATKDALPAGNAGKIVKGTEIDNEFNAIVDAVESKADLLNPVFSGLLTTDTLATGGAANIGGTLAVAGVLSAATDITQTGTGALNFAKGTTGQRPASPVTGAVRYNTTLNYLENYNGTAWKAVGDVVPADVCDEANTSTGYFQIPVGTSGQRTFTPANGVLRYNSSQNFYEGYANGQWIRFLSVNQGAYAARYLVISGGGGGGGAPGEFYASGGGGAGGVLTGNFTAEPNAVYTFVIGAGGAFNVNGSTSSLNGSAGTGISVAPVGGGAGGVSFTGTGNTGGSGGGAGMRVTSSGQGTASQGNRGGIGNFDGGGGGGGWGGIGGDATGAGGGNRTGGPGGIGATSDITGSAVFYAGGGGGASQDNQGAGGSGGGGNAIGGAGTANLGGGGGGGCFNTAGGSGGSGVAILSVPTLFYTGVYSGTPTVTTSGSNTILKFNSSGTYTA